MAANRWEELIDLTPWGKANGLDEPYPLVNHLLDSAAVAMALWDTYLACNQRSAIAAGLGLADDHAEARATVALCAGLHDVGKLSVGFQQLDKIGWGALSKTLSKDFGSAGMEKLGHAQAGMLGAPSLLTALGFGPADSSASPAWRVAQIIGGHHGRFHELDPVRAEGGCYLHSLGGPEWTAQRENYAHAVSHVLGSPRPPTQVSAPAAILVTGLVILADWLASQEHFLRTRQLRPAASLPEHFALARSAAPKLVADAGLVPVDLNRKDFAAAHNIPAPNPLQRSIVEDLPPAATGSGLLLVTAATGDGKTEAALEGERILSERCGTRGFAFLLPTMATSDQMYGRVSAFVGRQSPEAASVTLTHSMAWLSAAYSEDVLEAGPEVLLCDEDSEQSKPRPRVRRRMLPKRWLRGAKRPLLAQFAIGTIDQALMAALPVKHNALRMLALSGKTFIVDEAHAYDPYMQVLLGRLLHWLGAYGCPVVLLSATLPVSVSDRLVKEYLKGAGLSRKDLRGQSFRAPYPGWLFVRADTGEQTPILKGEQHSQADSRRMELAVQHETILYDEAPDDSTEPPPGPGSRLQVIEKLLQPLLTSDGGCALVVCTTVDEAQRTYTHLKQRLSSDGLEREEICLLHARLPGDERERRTTSLTTELGRAGERPHRRIVVATQVVEQSLDLDADLIISDLAPLALLLQRAGRCWRHENWWKSRGRPTGRERPCWSQSTGPRLVVLDPLLGVGDLPAAWGAIYPEYLFRRTSALLTERAGQPIRVPHDVQELVEQVHGDHPDEFDWDVTGKASASWAAYQGETFAQELTGRGVAIPASNQVMGLESLHRHLLDDEWDAATRLGVDSVRVLCVYEHPTGMLTFDEAGDDPLPEPDDKGRLSTAEVRTVMQRTIPIRATWFKGQEMEPLRHEPWGNHPMLADLVLLRHEVREGAVQPVQIGEHVCHLDPELGLVRK